MFKLALSENICKDFFLIQSKIFKMVDIFVVLCVSFLNCVKILPTLKNTE